MIERRLSHRLIAYWNLINKDGSLPNYALFNQTSVQDIWPNCMLLVAQPSQGKTGYKYNYIGAKLYDVYTENLLGRELGVMGKSMMNFSAINKKVEQVKNEKKPVEDESQFINEKSKIVKYRAVLLPFGGEAEGVTHIVVGLSWREF